MQSNRINGTHQLKHDGSEDSNCSSVGDHFGKEGTQHGQEVDNTEDGQPAQSRQSTADDV